MRTSTMHRLSPLSLLACGWSTCALLGVLAGCGTEGPRLAWTLGFADAALADETVSVSAFIVRGGCRGNERVYESALDSALPMSAAAASATSAPAPEALAPGVYGFGADARDGTCRTVATGCVERRLPASGDIDVMLTEARGEPLCAPSACAAGRCVDPNATTDASVVAGDAGTAATDAAMTATDAGMTATDAGTTEPGECTGGTRRPGGSCYRTLSTPATWPAARTACSAWHASADLLVVGDATEAAWIELTLAPSADYWLALTDGITDGVWLTSAGAAPAYLHWAPSEPDGGNALDCALFTVADDFWHDARCNDANAVVCERP